MFIIIICLCGDTRLKITENFSNLLLPPIYCINLKESTDRWKLIQEQAKKSDINIIRFEAVNGNNVSDNEFEQRIAKQPTVKMGKGQIGCALSHVYLWEFFQQQRTNEIALFLEDDIIIPANFKEQFSDLLQNLPPKWDIIFLGGCNIKGNLTENKKFIIPNVYENEYNLCAHALLVNKTSINKLLKITKPIYRPIDSLLREYFSELNVYFTYPNIIMQNKDIRSIRRDIDGYAQSQFWKENHDKITIV
jgi:glycosyl transferase family 25